MEKGKNVKNITAVSGFPGCINAGIFTGYVVSVVQDVVHIKHLSNTTALADSTPWPGTPSSSNLYTWDSMFRQRQMSLLTSPVAGTDGQLKVTYLILH